MKKLWLVVLLIMVFIPAAKEHPLKEHNYKYKPEIKYADFKVCYSKIRREEGYYVNDPNDLGRKTYAGITEKHNKDWLGWYYVDNANLCKNQRVTGKDSVITEVFVLDFYLDIWVKEGFYKLTNQEVANYLFDMRIHMYRNQTIKLLNKTFNLTQNIREVNWVQPSFDSLNLFKLRQARIAYYMRLFNKRPDQLVFKKNWLSRALR